MMSIMTDLGPEDANLMIEGLKKVKNTKRPYAQPNAQRRSIYTDDETWAKLLKLGNGNASAGIREAVRQAQEREDGLL